MQMLQPSERVYTCSCYGKTEAWGETWRWFAKPKKANSPHAKYGDPEPDIIVCSEACARLMVPEHFQTYHNPVDGQEEKE